jgi:hypothetical protein
MATMMESWPGPDHPGMPKAAYFRGTPAQIAEQRKAWVAKYGTPPENSFEIEVADLRHSRRG